MGPGHVHGAWGTAKNHRAIAPGLHDMILSVTMIVALRAYTILPHPCVLDAQIHRHLPGRLESCMLLACLLQCPPKSVCWAFQVQLKLIFEAGVLPRPLKCLHNLCVPLLSLDDGCGHRVYYSTLRVHPCGSSTAWPLVLCGLNVVSSPPPGGDAIARKWS